MSQTKEELQGQMKRIIAGLIAIIEDPSQRVEISEEQVEAFKEEMGLKNNEPLARYLLNLTRIQSVLFTKAFERDIIQIKKIVTELQKMVDSIVNS